MKNRAPWNKIVLLILGAAAAIGLAVFVLGPSGPLVGLSGLDLNFVLIPLLLLIIISFSALLVRLLVVSTYVALGSIILNYAAVSLCSYLLFDRLILFSRLPSLAEHTEVLNALSSISVWLALFWLGCCLIHCSRFLRSAGGFKRYLTTLLSLAGFVVCGVTIWQTAGLLGPLVQWLPGAGQVLGVALMAVGISRLAGLALENSASIINEALVWLANSGAAVFWITLAAAAYYVYLRPLLYRISQYAYLIEWILFCIVGLIVLSALRNRLKSLHSLPLVELLWSKHRQTINLIADDDYNKMVVLQLDFIDSGSHRDLLVYLHRLLAANGVTEEEIGSYLQPLIEYSDIKKNRLYLSLFKKRITRDNRARRNYALEQTLNNIRGLVYHNGLKKA